MQSWRCEQSCNQEFFKKDTTMNESELGKALLRRESDVDAKAMADAVMRRDRHRIWSMTVGCVTAWMLVVALAWGTILPMLAKVAEFEMHLSAASTLPAPDQKERLLEMLRAIKGGTMATCLGTTATTLVAALCTVRLITASRTATLRQVNSRLDEISAQLKSLASSLPK
jgi:hypothetical protein